MRILLMFFLCLAMIPFSIGQDVQLYQKNENGNIVIMGKNISSFDYSVELKFDANGYNASSLSPSNKIVSSKSEARLLVLTPISGVKKTLFIDYNVLKLKNSSSYRRLASSEDFTGITLFTLYGCKKCSFVIETLNMLNIPFKEKCISFSDDDKDLMWAKVRENNYYGDNVKMPVIVIDNKTHFNIPDLKAFIYNLKF